MNYLNNKLNDYFVKKGLNTEDIINDITNGCIADDQDFIYNKEKSWLNSPSGVLDPQDNKELTVFDIINKKISMYKYSGCNAAIFIPIFSLDNELVGLSIRKMCDEQKHDSWFKPGHGKLDIVYGLNTSYKNIVQKQSIILTEGVYDAIALRKYGFSQACALLGTHMSNLQFFQIAALTKNICLCLDNDNAGITAVNKIVEKYGKIYGDLVKFYTITLDKDPDEFLKEQGPDNFKRRIKLC